MASTYSDLKFELIGTGDQSGTWGNTTNDNIGTAIEQAIVGLGNPIFTTDANLTITLTNTVALQTARALVLNATSSGSLTATRELVVPTIEKQYIVQNNTSGGQSITVKTTAGTGITVPNGKKMHLYVDGVNVVDAVSHFSSLTLASALPVLSGGTGVTTSTGTGAVVLSTSPTLVTPVLGTPTSVTLTNATGLPISTGVSGLGTGVATFLATPSSANLAAAVTDETGTGALVFATSPTLVTPALGTPASGVVTNLTGTASININGTVGATTASTGAFTSLTASTTLGVTGLSTLTAGAVVQGLTVGRGAGAVATNTAVGSSALAANTSGDENTGLGRLALRDTATGSYNTAVGSGPLVLLTTGSNNTAIGRAALQVATTSSDNTAVGYRSMIATTTGAYNTALGSEALQANTTASNNTAVGYQAGFSNTTNPELTAIGYQASSSATGGFSTSLGYHAGYGQTTGDSNTYVGRGVASINTATGSHNSALGNFALARVTSGSFNVAIGSAALESNTTASNNTAVGYQSLYENTTGASNVALGYQALEANTTASNNTAVGYQAGFSNTTGTSNTYIGYFAGRAITTQNENTAVGFNSLAVSTGDSNTAFGERSMQANTTGTLNTALGSFALATNTTGSRNVAVGREALSSLTTGADNTAIGPTTSGSLITTGSKNTILGDYNGNQDGLDIRTSSNFIVLSDGDGLRQITMKEGQTLALDSAVPNAGTGITFPATQNASSNANTLDDYEEGTWTPTVEFGGASVGVTYSATRQGTYTKVGRAVTIQCQIVLTSKGSSTGAMSVSGLPFTSHANATAATVWIDTSAAAIVAPVTSLIFASGAAINFFFVATGSQSNYTNTQAQDTSNIVVTTTYFV